MRKYKIGDIIKTIDPESFKKELEKEDFHTRVFISDAYSDYLNKVGTITDILFFPINNSYMYKLSVSGRAINWPSDYFSLYCSKQKFNLDEV